LSFALRKLSLKPIIHSALSLISGAKLNLIDYNTERLEIVEICRRFSQGDSTKYYVDMETAPEKGIMMSSKRYNDKIFYL